MLLRLLAEEEARETAVPQEWSLLGEADIPEIYEYAP